MQRLSGKRIVVGISGGIAAYKAPLLVRQLLAEGADVQVVMTDNAHQFVTATTLQAVSGHPVRTSLWDNAAEAAMGHIELARWADLIIIAPATASVLARLAGGFADDLLTTLCLATPAPLHVAPAMNQGMWRHPATENNLEILRRRGVRIQGPGDGDQACGDVGPGRLLEPQALVEALINQNQPGVLAGIRVLVTAGPTREALDPVRYISNHSSGKQGYAVAAAARQQGAHVTLVSGPVALSAPEGVEVIEVVSAEQMYRAVMAAAPSQDIVIAVAAVADYRPVRVAAQKIKKTGNLDSTRIELTQNPDIIAGVAQLPSPPFTVGFAAETEQALVHARTKRERKGLDMIVVNDVSRADIGFNNDDNAVTIITDQGERHLDQADKFAIARELILEIAQSRSRKLAAPNPVTLAD